VLIRPTNKYTYYSANFARRYAVLLANDYHNSVIADAGTLRWRFTKSSVKERDDTLRCSTKAHNISRRTLCLMSNQKLSNPSQRHFDSDSEMNVHVNDSIHKVVLVGIWNEGKNKNGITTLGSGFIVDKKKGLIMTSSPILMHINGKKDFGKDYFGNKSGKAVIGIIPDNGNDKTQAVFCNFAKIVAKGIQMEGEEKYCQIDACVLQITTKIVSDVGVYGNKCEKVIENVI